MRMTTCASAVAFVLVAALPAIADDGAVSGQYVEARTAEVFTGGCIMGSEAETMGREALMAWQIERGRFAGVDLQGLSVVAAVAADRNLGIREIGGEAPTAVRAALFVDEQATAAQRDALVAFAREMSGGLADRVVEVKSVPIAFAREGDRIEVSAGEAKLLVHAGVKHDPGCGAMQWFHPLSLGTDARVSLTKQQAYSGNVLGRKWSQVDRRSAFAGTFSIDPAVLAGS